MVLAMAMQCSLSPMPRLSWRTAKRANYSDDIVFAGPQQRGIESRRQFSSYQCMSHCSYHRSSMLVLVVLFSAVANHTSSAEATGWPSVLRSLDLFGLSACYPWQVCRPAGEEGITRCIGDGVCQSLASHCCEIWHHTLDGRWKYATHQGNGAYHQPA